MHTEQQGIPSTLGAGLDYCHCICGYMYVHRVPNPGLPFSQLFSCRVGECWNWSRMSPMKRGSFVIPFLVLRMCLLEEAEVEEEVACRVARLCMWVCVCVWWVVCEKEREERECASTGWSCMREGRTVRSIFESVMVTLQEWYCLLFYVTYRVSQAIHENSSTYLLTESNKGSEKSS